MEQEQDLDIILNDDEEQVEITPSLILKHKINEVEDNIHQFYTSFAKNTKTTIQNYLQFKTHPGVKSVCAKIVRQKDTIVECYNCRMDSSCIICLQCFQNGNHEGHKYIIKKAYGGCCDCGDVQAWKKQGFCKNHSGQIIDTQLDQEQQKKFNKTFGDLFKIYFQLLRRNENNSPAFLKKILDYLINLCNGSTYFNKMITNFLTMEKLVLVKPQQPVNFLQAFLMFKTDNTTGMINDFFVCLFPYYRFKQQLLAAYFDNYHLIYDRRQFTLNFGSSISCQLLTSYQLVDDYIKRQKTVPIGQKITLNSNIQKTLSLCTLILSDLSKICKLKEQVALHYFQYHIKNGFNSPFLYYKQIKNICIKIDLIGQQNPQLFKTNILIKFAYIQYYTVQTLIEIIKTIKNDFETLGMLLKHLYQLMISQNESDCLKIFKPYQRSFSVVLFAFFQMNLQNCSNVQKLLKVLNVTKQQFCIKCSSILKRILKTYLYYCQIITTPGLSSSTLHYYLACYKNKSKILMFLDILLIKQLILICNIQPCFIFEFIKSQDIKASIQMYILTIESFHLLYVSKIYEMYIAHSLTKGECLLYEKQLKKIFVNLIKELDNNVQKKMIQQIRENIFSQSVNIMEQCFKKWCVYDKAKNSFNLKEQYQNQIGLNLNNFRTTFTPKPSKYNHHKTIAYIDDYNLSILNKVWSNETTKKMIKCFHQIQSQSPPLSLLKLIIDYYGQISLILHHFNIPSLELINNYILKTNFVQKLLKQNTLQQQLNQQHPNMIMEKKKSIKQQRINEMKQKQKRVLSNLKSKQDIKIQQNSQPIICSICKNQKTNRFIYLIQIRICNYEKLLQKISSQKGVECISIKSCYHIFDFQCIKKHIEFNNIYQFRCPVCRSSMNSFLPYQQDKMITQQSKNQMQLILNKLSNNKLVVQQQILKSFYHYVLLSIADFEFSIKKKSKIYRGLYRLFKNITSIEQIYKLKKLFQNKKLVTKFDNIKIMNNKPKNSIVTILQELIRRQQNGVNLNQANINSLIEQGLQIQLERQQRKQQIQSKQKIKEVDKILDYHQYFKYTISKILSDILKEQFKINHSTYQYRCIDIAINSIINIQQEGDSQMFNQRILQQGLQLNKNQDPPKYFSLRHLPSIYQPLGKIVNCKFCHKISSTLIICLLCQDWISCFSCTASSTQEHSQKFHGFNGLFLSIQKAQLFSFNQKGEVIPLGILYKDQFGMAFKITKEWKDFKLDQLMLKSIEMKLIHEQLQIG